MIGRVIVVGEMRGREVAALFVDGQIEDLLVEPGADAPPPAARSTARWWTGMVKGQGGVFLRLPDGARAFLRETGGLAPGQPVLVQVTGFAEPGKARAGHAAPAVQVAPEHRHAGCAGHQHLAPDPRRGPARPSGRIGRHRDGRRG